MLYFSDPHERNWFSCIIKTSLRITRAHDVRGSSCNCTPLECGIYIFHSNLCKSGRFYLAIYLRKSIVPTDDGIILTDG